MPSLARVEERKPSHAIMYVERTLLSWLVVASRKVVVTPSASCSKSIISVKKRNCEPSSCTFALRRVSIALLGEKGASCCRKISNTLSCTIVSVRADSCRPALVC